MQMTPTELRSFSPSITAYNGVIHFHFRHKYRRTYSLHDPVALLMVLESIYQGGIMFMMCDIKYLINPLTYFDGCGSSVCCFTTVK
jgi:hypothetical protein